MCLDAPCTGNNRSPAQEPHLLASDDIFCSPCGKREPSRRTEYYSAYLCDRTGIGVQYYIYCSPIPMLQTGVGFKALRGGTKNALGSSAPTSHGPRSDLRRAASSVDKTRNDCSLKRGISRLHRQIYRTAAEFFSPQFTKTSPRNSPEVGSSLIEEKNAPTFKLPVFKNKSPYTGRLRNDFSLRKYTHA